MSVQRVLVTSDAYVLCPAFTDATGEAADCASTPTVTCTRDDGTVLTAPVVTDASGTGVYQAKLEDTIQTTRLDWLTLVWTGTVTGLGLVTQTQRVEVVGGFYLTVPQVRGLSGMEAHKVTAARIREVCNDFEDLAEDYLGRAFVPRYQSDNMRGTGTHDVLLSRYPARTLVSAAAVNTSGVLTAFTTTNWLLNRSGLLTTDGDVFTAPAIGDEPNVTVRYTHGEEAPTSRLVEAAKVWVRSHLLLDRAGIARDVLSMIDSQTGGSTRYSTPDWNAGRPTGLLDVDAALNSIGRDMPVLA